MKPKKISSKRKKKIKSVLSMMNTQNQRLNPIVPPLVEAMDLVTTDDELDFLLKMGAGQYEYD